MVTRFAELRKKNHENDGGFTLIELLVVIIILGVLSAIVVFAVRGSGDKGKSAAYSTDTKTFRTAEEAFCAKFGRYGTEQELVDQKFLSEASVYTDVALSSGGPCGTGPESKFSLTTAVATVNIAANADQWQVSDTGSGSGYSSSAFVYPLNSNLNDPLIIMNSNYTISGGLAASWERIPVGTNRNTVDGMTPGSPAPLPSTPTPYPTCGGINDRPFCTDTWRFHLRTGVTFHDGAPFNADDVIWTWRDRQPVSGSPSSGQNTLGNTMYLSARPDAWDSVEKIDNFTVDFTPKVQNLRFPEQVLHPKGAIVQVLRDGSGNPVSAPFGQLAGMSTPRYLGRHLDGSTGGLPANTGVYLGVTRASSTTTSGSTAVTGPNFVAGDVGLAVFGTGIPSQTLITAVNPGVSAMLSKAATASGTVTLTLATSPASTGSPVPGKPMGTGPFKHVSYNWTSPQGGGTASFVRNDDYWGSVKPQVQGMNYTFIADPAVRTAGLMSGQYDMAIDLDPLAVATVEGSGRSVVKAPFGQNALIYVNKVVKDATGTLDPTRVPPATPAGHRFNIGTDPAVRKAASLAIDRDAIVNAIFAGNAQPGRWMSPPGILGSYSGSVPTMTTNVALANSTLDADGWTCANGGPQGTPGANTPCATNEIRKWNGDSRFTVGRQLDLYMVGISLVPQTEYDLLSAQMKLAGINLITQRGTCDGSQTCPDGSVGRGYMYNSSLWDFDLELPNQNDANAAFLPVLRQACVNEATTFRFAPADGTNGVGSAVSDTANGGGTFPFGKTPCTSPGNVKGPMDQSTITYDGGGALTGGFVAASAAATTAQQNQEAAANMMRVLVGQNESNIVIPIVGQYRIYGMSSKVSLGDPHPSQTSQRWVSLTMTF